MLVQGEKSSIKTFVELRLRSRKYNPMWIYFFLSSFFSSRQLTIIFTVKWAHVYWTTSLEKDWECKILTKRTKANLPGMREAFSAWRNKTRTNMHNYFRFYLDERRVSLAVFLSFLSRAELTKYLAQRKQKTRPRRNMYPKKYVSENDDTPGIRIKVLNETSNGSSARTTRSIPHALRGSDSNMRKI
jgi:hypothetical protein